MVLLMNDVGKRTLEDCVEIAIDVERSASTKKERRAVGDAQAGKSERYSIFYPVW